MTATCFPAARERCTARRWVGATHASPLPRRRLATSNSPVAHPVTLLHEDDTRTMHLVEHDSVCDGSHACVSSIPSVFTGRGEDTPTPARPRWGRESSAQAGGGRAGGRAPRRAIGRFPLSCLLSLYHPHPNPPPLGAGVIGAGRVVERAGGRAPSEPIGAAFRCPVCCPCIAPTPARPRWGREFASPQRKNHLTIPPPSGRITLPFLPPAEESPYHSSSSGENHLTIPPPSGGRSGGGPGLWCPATLAEHAPSPLPTPHSPLP